MLARKPGLMCLSQISVTPSPMDRVAYQSSIMERPEHQGPGSQEAVTAHADGWSISPQVPRVRDKPAFIGILGATLSLEEGQRAAQLCALNILAQIKAAAGDLDCVASILRLVGYVASTADFKEHHKVMNGASELMLDIFGDLGRHARTSVGVAALPQGVPVEVEATVELL
jgi:enamine deaminase RidA (YjgF/YER057c/UK114 family)